MVVPNWLLRETFMVEHNPNCPSPFLVRLVGKGKGYIRRNSDDVRGYGQTLEDAATMAMKLAGKFTAVETSALCPHGMPLAENICGPCSSGEPNHQWLIRKRGY